jgi:hypothetical protein
MAYFRIIPECANRVKKPLEGIYYKLETEDLELALEFKSKLNVVIKHWVLEFVKAEHTDYPEYFAYNYQIPKPKAPLQSEDDGSSDLGN